MAFPPKTPFSGPPAAPAAPAATPKLSSMTLAEASAMGTTAGAPAAATSKGPPAGSGLPGSGPPPAMPGQAPAPAAQGAGVTADRPVVAAHFNTPSVGTHPSASPHKQGNPSHGMSNV
jgi:hypothetical protein